MNVQKKKSKEETSGTRKQLEFKDFRKKLCVYDVKS